MMREIKRDTRQLNASGEGLFDFAPGNKNNISLLQDLPSMPRGSMFQWLMVTGSTCRRATYIW